MTGGDNDDNYIPLDGVGPDDSTNLEESPSVVAAPIVLNVTKETP